MTKKQAFSPFGRNPKLNRITVEDAKKLLETPKKPKLKVGDVVVATCVITDRNASDLHYIHATPGMLGIVINDECHGGVDQGWPLIRWGVRELGGVCNVTPDEFELYSGKVVCAID